MKRRHRIGLFLVLLICVSIVGCAAAPALQSTADEGMAYSPAPSEPEMAPVAPQKASDSVLGEYGLSAGSAGEEGFRAALEEATGERMIIRRADVSILVEDTDEVLGALNDMVARYQGYVAESNRWYDDEQLYASMTLRIPAMSLDAALAEIGDLAIKVQNQNVSGDDVTEEYSDVEARLRNLTATETELLELLTEVRQNRGEADEILAIYREITDIRGQIESLEGRRIYLERMTALSTVYLQIRPEAAPISVVEDRWNPLVTVSNAARSLVKVAQGVLSAAIYIVVLSPIVIVPVGLLWLLAYLLRRRKRRREAAVE